MSDLRKAFWSQIYEIAKKDKDVVVLTGDLGYSFCENFQKDFPDQFINAGCAEQNMVGVAAGLARVGKKPHVYSNAIFLLMRAYEQVRDDIAYPNLNVKLIGANASGFLGFTHNMQGSENCEDLLKNLPNLIMAFSQNEVELQNTMHSTYENKNPTFIQL